MKRIIIAFCCMAPFISITWGATIRIPADYASINAAVGAASEGDEIVISPGTYESGDIYGKRVTLRSTFDGKDWSIVENTRIKGTIGISVAGNGSTIRGLRIGPDPMPTPPIPIMMIGIWGEGVHANIEYCIIENCNNQSGSSGPDQYGGAIKGITGVIQNNILRNNRADGDSAMSDCGGIIRNNVIYNNNGYDVEITAYRATEFTNNTVYSNAKVGVGLWPTSINANNIYWQSGSGAAFGALNPRNCVIKGYTGTAEGIITADPKFVDPANADFHLQSSSPCIDAGITTGTAKADIVGVQRGLKGTTLLRGDGSGIDIGAFEYKPKPVAVWLPNGGPDEINAGDNLKVAWELETTTAGTAVNLELFNGEYKVADLGSFWSAAGAAESTVKLPTNIPPRSTYTIRGISNWNQAYHSNTPYMSIASPFTSIPSILWSKYL